MATRTTTTSTPTGGLLCRFSGSMPSPAPLRRRGTPVPSAPSRWPPSHVISYTLPVPTGGVLIRTDGHLRVPVSPRVVGRLVHVRRARKRCRTRNILRGPFEACVEVSSASEENRLNLALKSHAPRAVAQRGTGSHLYCVSCIGILHDVCGMGCRLPFAYF